MRQIYSDLKDLLGYLADPQHSSVVASYQRAYIQFRGLVVDAAEENEVYQQWAQQYLTDVSDETGEVVKMHESAEELKADIMAFIQLIDRNEGY